MKKSVKLENLNEKFISEDLVLQYFKGVDEEDIARLLKTGNRKKWNIFKMKQNL